MATKNQLSKDIVIKNEYELNNLKHNETLSFTFDKINIDSIHFKTINFNLFESQLLKKLHFKKITFEDCVLGNLHSLDFTNCEDICVINQPMDSYFMNAVNPIRNFYLDNNDLTTLSLFISRYYHTLSIKNNNIKGMLSSLKKTSIGKLILDDMNNYSVSDLEYLKMKIETKEIHKLFFNDSEVDANKLFYNRKCLKYILIKT